MDTNSRASIRGQLSARGIVIGSLGCIIITASSAYTALRLGALPWPIIFAAVISLFFLKLFGSNSLNEANVTHTIMSAGAMVAGGLAFTIPGAWMLGLADQTTWLSIHSVALSGTLLGLVATALIHRHFIVETDLAFPTGYAAAETLRATDAGGATGRQLALSMGIAGIWAALRDGLGLMPAILGAPLIPGISFGLYNSPMMASVGFLVGGAAVAFWFAGALLANFGIIWAAPAAGIISLGTAQALVQSLGMGLMMGAGIAVVVKDIAPELISTLRHSFSANKSNLSTPSLLSGSLKLDAGIFGLIAAAVFVLVAWGLGLGAIPAVCIIVLAFVTATMAAQSCGQTGIDPMEIFGLIVMLIIAALGNIAQVKLFFVAAIIAVACGVSGDVMNDFKAGQVLGTSPRAQWIGQAIGGILGAIVSAAVLSALLSAYGPDAFGPGKLFVAAQASVVATMVSGIPHIPAFIVGIVAGVALYWVKLPAMLFGLGVYLPFYLSATAALGALIKLVYDRANKSHLTQDNSAADERGLVVASGLMGGESIVGVIIAFISVISGFGA